MLIGIDASRALSSQKAGPENYSFYLISEMLKLPSRHSFRLYFSKTFKPIEDNFLKNINRDKLEIVRINWPKLWTQGGLALECYRRPPAVLFIPAHTIPLIRAKSLKTVVTIHDLGARFLPNYHKFPQKYYLNLTTEYSIKNATKLIAVSSYTKKDIVQKFSVAESKIAVVYEGYDKEVYYPRSVREIHAAKEKFGLKGDYFFFQSTIQPRKNLVRLIEAFSLIVRKFNQREIRLVLAGKPGWLYKEIYEAPEKYGVSQLVKFLGYLEDENDSASLMSGALAYVHPSLFEGFSITLLEAMACSVPVISSKLSSIPEVGGEALIYVDSYSVDDLVAKMTFVLEMGLFSRSEITSKGLARAAQFSWKEAASKTLKVLEATYD